MSLVLMTKKERRYVLILVIIILILESLPFTFRYILPNNPEILPEEKERLFALAHQYLDSLQNSRLSYRITHQKESETFDFDPNKISRDSMILLGFSSKTASNLLKYRERGGRIKHIAGMKRIYGIDTSLISRLKEHILIPRNTNKKISSSRKITLQDHSGNFHQKSLGSGEIQTHVPVNINQADSIGLVELKGIGPILSSRIIKYRQLLGGFHRKDQLNEVYGLRQETFENINDKITVHGPLVMLDIKMRSFKELLRHPYTNYEMTKWLKNRADLPPDSIITLLYASFPKDDVDKLAPYIFKK